MQNIIRNKVIKVLPPGAVFEKYKKFNNIHKSIYAKANISQQNDWRNVNLVKYFIQGGLPR